MLASSFMTAKALGITEPERQVLIEFQRRAAAGDIPEELFDMGEIGQPECGTPGCIAGWCLAIDREAGRMLCSRYYEPIFHIFRCNAPHSTVAAAGEAIYRYLTTGTA